MSFRSSYGPSRAAGLLLLAITLLFPGSAGAQSAAERLVGDWLDAQEAARSAVERVTLRAEMVLSLTSGQTTRRIESQTLFSFVPGQPPDRTLERLSVDGTPVPPENTDRYDERMRALIGDGPEGELIAGSQATGALLPGLLVRNLRLAPRVELRDREGEQFRVVTGRLEPPDHGPGQRPGQRPGMRPGGPPGRVSGGRRPPPPLSATPPRHVVTLWFAATSARLVLVEHRIAMPRGQGLLVRTRMERVGPLDVPAFRTMEGEIPSVRRLRTVTLHLDQRITFQDHVLTLVE